MTCARYDAPTWSSHSSLLTYFTQPCRATAALTTTACRSEGEGGGGWQTSGCVSRPETDRRSREETEGCDILRHALFLRQLACDEHISTPAGSQPNGPIYKHHDIKLETGYLGNPKRVQGPIRNPSSALPTSSIQGIKTSRFPLSMGCLDRSLFFSFLVFFSLFFPFAYPCGWIPRPNLFCKTPNSNHGEIVEKKKEKILGIDASGINSSKIGRMTKAQTQTCKKKGEF